MRNGMNKSESHQKRKARKETTTWMAHKDHSNSHSLAEHQQVSIVSSSFSFQRLVARVWIGGIGFEAPVLEDSL